MLGFESPLRQRLHCTLLEFFMGITESKVPLLERENIYGDDTLSYFKGVC